MKSSNDPDRGSALRRVRGVIERLVRDGTAVARSDGTLYNIFPVAVYAAEGEALREWVLCEGATRTIEVGHGYGISALHVCEGGRPRGVVLCNEPGLDARGSLGRGRSPPVCRPPHLRGRGHATVRLLRRVLMSEPLHATCSGLRPDYGGWEVRVGAFAMYRGLGENARAHGR